MNSLSDWAALIASVILVCLTVFQTLLAVGLPFGNAAFGGANAVLSTKLRLASAASSVVSLMALSSNHWTEIDRGLDDSCLLTVTHRQPST